MYTYTMNLDLFSNLEHGKWERERKKNVSELIEIGLVLELE